MGGGEGGDEGDEGEARSVVSEGVNSEEVVAAEEEDSEVAEMLRDNEVPPQW